MDRQVSADADVIVLGSGAAGLTAALVSARAGMCVILIEKSEWIGGTSALSGGAPFVPGNPFMDRLEGDDDRASAECYLRAVLGNRYDAEKFDAFLESAPRMLAELRHDCGIAFVPSGLPDYSPDASGARMNRTVASPPLDARRMDPELLSKIRAPLRQLSLFGTMQVASSDMPALRGAFQSFKDFRAAAGLVAQHFFSLARFGMPTRLVAGRALVARLLDAATRAGVEVRTGCMVQRLTVEDGAVRGVELAGASGGELLAAHKGVVIATGGFGGSPERRREYVAMAGAGYSMQPESCTGDGIALGVAAGGQIVGDNGPNALGAPVSVLVNKDGSRVVFPHFAFDRHFPGAIVVGPDGRRFCNEARDYHKVVGAMHANGFDYAWLVADEAMRAKYGMGMVRPWPFPIGQWQRRGYLFSANSIGALAGKIGVDADMLRQTVAAYNTSADTGDDPLFGRGKDAYSRRMGDAFHQPNPNVGPLAKAPFHAIRLLPGDLSTFVGLATDADARVLSSDGSAIPGLYAIGLDMAPIARGDYPSGGFGLGPGMTFGWRAARALALQNPL